MNKHRKKVFAIDGPSATGKGSAVNGIIEHLKTDDISCAKIEAGQGHRALAYYALNNLPKLVDRQEWTKAAKIACASLSITEAGWTLENEVINSELLYSPEINNIVARFGETDEAQSVVDRLSIEQINYSSADVNILEGRGKLQLIEEAIKGNRIRNGLLLGAFYLDANPLEMAFRQLARSQNKSVDLLSLSAQEIRTEIASVNERNIRDTKRAINPLVIPPADERIDIKSLFFKDITEGDFEQLAFNFHTPTRPFSIYVDTSNLQTVDTKSLCGVVAKKLYDFSIQAK